MSSAHVWNHGHQRSKNSALQPWTLPTFSVHCARQLNPNLILLFQILSNNVLLYQLLLILVLPSGPIPKSAETRYAKAGTTASSPQDFYTAEALYLAWSLRDAAVADYMKQTRENGLTTGYVSITERKTVVDWLEGRIPDHDRIRPAPQGERNHNISERYLCVVSGIYNSTRFTTPKPPCISIYDPKVSSG